MQVVTREPNVADADRIATVHVSSWEETYSALVPDGFFTDEYREKRRAMWREQLSALPDGVAVRVAEVDDVIVGFAWVGPSLDEQPTHAIQLYSLYVLAAFHGSGVGQRLLTETLSARDATLWVAAANPRAIAFYERNGFVRDGAEQVPPAAPLLRSVRMVRATDEPTG